MVSTNHFRGRRLSGGKRSPITPRPQGNGPFPPHYEQASGCNRWCVQAAHLPDISTVPLHTAVPYFVADNNWREDGFDTDGREYHLDILWDQFSFNLNFFYLVGPLVNYDYWALQNNFPWDGRTPFTFGPYGFDPGWDWANGSITAFVKYR